uniref:Uncharacterized protein n=1 Tax=Acrobeloides nanus TaxID=290746 RepID=A0A914E7E5_9BILA
MERLNNASKVNTLNKFHITKMIKIQKEINETNRIVKEELYLVTEIETHNCESIFKRFNQKCKELIDRLSNETRLQNAKYTLELRTKSLEKMLEHARELENNDDYICSIQPQWISCLLRMRHVGETEILLIGARDAEKLHIIVENKAKSLKCQCDSFWKTITFQC